jgi:type I restriction enzyme R subunit
LVGAYSFVLVEEIRTTGTETFFRDLRDPNPRSRQVFAFHKPETLGLWLSQIDTLRKKLRNMPPLIETGVRDCQIEAIRNLEKSFAHDKPRALIQMASGSEFWLGILLANF